MWQLATYSRMNTSFTYYKKIMNKLNIASGLVLTLAAGLILTTSGCGDDYEREQAYNLAHPKISDEVNVDGCSVKYVDRGQSYKSFYIARCDGTTTLTTNYTSGKSAARMVSINKQIADLTAQRDAITKEEAVKHEALTKLSPDERAALGLSASDAGATQ